MKKTARSGKQAPGAMAAGNVDIGAATEGVTAGKASETRSLHTGLFHSLSFRLLLLTTAFMLLGMVSVFLLTMASFRVTWLQDRLLIAEVAALAVISAGPDERVERPMEQKVLRSAGVQVIAVREGNARRLVLQSRKPPMIQARHDLRRLSTWRSVREVLATLWARGQREVLVIGRPRALEANFIELAMHEKALYQALLQQAGVIGRNALLLAVAGGVLLYLALHVLFVRPLRRLQAAVRTFGDDPERAPAEVVSGRRDEIGDLEVALAAMQSRVRESLREKSRLAALGLAVSRIAHELRNMLTAAQLVSDRLGELNDPTARRLAPKLVRSIDRAVSFCSATLKFGRLREPDPARRRFALRELVADVFAALPEAEGVRLVNEVPEGLRIDADPDQLFRALFNLSHNALRALATHGAANAHSPTISVSARALDDGVEIIVADNGPGLPTRVTERLFEPFAHGAAATGGTGLGLAITREIVEGHGGRIDYLSANRHAAGAVFRLFIPGRARLVDVTDATARRSAS